jgi:uncharacterized protein YecE (DUF72 family)
VCEPRHATWFQPVASALLTRFEVARVAADPPPAAGAALPGGWAGIIYFRQHGSPRKYWSPYTAEAIAALAAATRSVNAPAVWCIFDNTAGGAAFGNACDLQARVAEVND